MAGPLYYPPSQNAVQKTLGSALSAGTTASATLNNVTGIQNKPGIMVIDRVNTAGTETSNKREYIAYTGTSGSTVTGLTRNVDGSGSDQDHAIGAVVEFIPDVMWAESVNDALANIVNTTTLALDTTKVADASSAQTLTNKTLASPNLQIGSDAQGDLYVRQSGASLGRIARGTYGQTLQMNATLPSWGYNEFSPWTQLTDASTMYIDFAASTKYMVTVVPSGLRTFLPTNATLGSMAILRIKYASTVSIGVNLFTANATISWYGGGTAPTPTCTVNKVDLFGFACTATLPEFDGIVIGQNRG